MMPSKAHARNAPDPPGSKTVEFSTLQYNPDWLTFGVKAGIRLEKGSKQG